MNAFGLTERTVLFHQRQAVAENVATPKRILREPPWTGDFGARSAGPTGSCLTICFPPAPAARSKLDATHAFRRHTPCDEVRLRMSTERRPTGAN